MKHINKLYGTFFVTIVIQNIVKNLICSLQLIYMRIFLVFKVIMSGTNLILIIQIASRI